MDFEYGRIEDLEENEKGYIVISIRQNIAYKTISRKFNVWNIDYLKKQMGEALQIGTDVKFLAVKIGTYYKLQTMEESEFSECFGCGSYTALRNKQQIECENCFGSMPRKKIDKELKLVKKNIKQNKFSLSITLTFIDETEECLNHTLYISTIFESNPLYNKLCQLKVGNKNHICGWMNDNEDQPTNFFEMVDVNDTYMNE